MLTTTKMNFLKNKFLWFLFAMFFMRIIFAFTTFHPDVWSNMDWGTRFFDYGANGFYSPDANVWNYTWPNQPPGSILIYAATYKLYLGIFSILWWLNIHISLFPSVVVSYSELNLYRALIQFPSIIADFGIALLIYKIVLKLKDKKAARLGAMLFLVNPVIWYNSSVWGQTDAIVNLFGLLAFYLLFKKQLGSAIAAYVLSIYIKISLLIFAPIFLIYAWKKFGFKSLLIKPIPTLLAMLSITWFFSNKTGKDPVSWLYWLYTNKVLSQQLQVITANALNIWAAITGINEQPQSLPFLGLTYQYWSYILFIVFTLPIIYSIYKKQSEKTAISSLALIAFSSWSLLTNMHERYLYPLFPYLTIMTALESRLMPIYWLVSGLNLINLYNIWFTPRVELFVNILTLKGKIVPRVLGAFNFILFVKFWVKHAKI